MVVMTAMTHMSLHFQNVIGHGWGYYVLKQSAAGLLTEQMPIIQKHQA